MRIFFSAILATLFAVSVARRAAAPQPNPSDLKFQSRGEQDRTYTFPGTSEQISYHVYVPMKWDKNIRMPLVIVTHGANQPPTSTVPATDGESDVGENGRGAWLRRCRGHRVSRERDGVGGWNVPYPMVQVPRPAAAADAGGEGAGRRGRSRSRAPPPTAEDFQRAEMDVLYVAGLMATEYNTDPNRTYLMGNSSGGSAVWNIAAKFPERWTAISPSAAPLEDTTFRTTS
jgi:poly(3-hydroxybutyrate) depolymerase